MESWGPYKYIKVVFSLIPFAIAFWGNEKFLMAFGFFVMTFSLITIANHLEALREKLARG